MTFASRLTRCPRAYEPDRAAELAEMFAGEGPQIAGLLAATGGCSPYLKTLAEREADWLRAALAGAPEDAFAGVLADVAALDRAALQAGLREAKRRVALLVALADLGGVWSLEEATRALTDFADAATDKALRELVAFEIGRGKLAGLTEADIETAGGYTVIAMGKMGAHELNYSSDIDLICLFDETRVGADDFHELRAGFVRITRRMTALLSDITAEGYVFRTDLRLRPDASVTPVVISMDAAEHYYESLGRTWERAAYIKARACAGDIAAGRRFLERLTPFIWRRHLDYAAIQDAHDMRLRIREHKGLHKRAALDGHDMKLGSGGIREIEFFTQTRQIIAGGREPALRVRGTVEGLKALAATGWERDAEELIPHYRFHREVEHRLQMVADQQTHKLPTGAEGFDRLAAFMDRETEDLRREIRERLDHVATVTEHFFAPTETAPKPSAPIELDEEARAITARWTSYPALRSARASEIFERIKPQLFDRLGRAARPQEALRHLDGFMAGLPAGVQLFSLFEANPQLVDLIVDIAATAPELSRYLARNSSVFDAVIGGAFFAPWPGHDALTEGLARALAELQDYEAQLDTARRWHKEWHFRIGVHHLRGLIGSEEAQSQYTDLADAVLAALFGPITEAFAAKHGAPPGRGASVLGMGSLGAGELTATSDLDLIVIYDAQGADASDGKRPLNTRSYYARLTQAMVTALSAPTAEGKLYEVDMRLRPSGRQGPVATAFSSFTSYQQTEAWTWEHLALTRARPVAGNPELGRDVEAFRTELLAQRREPQTVLADVASMRARLFEAKPPSGDWDMKLGPGRAQDIALLAQAAAYLSGAAERDVPAQLGYAADALGLKAADIESLRAAYRLFLSVQDVARLTSAGVLDPDALGEGGRAFLLRETGHETTETLREALDSAADRAAHIVDRVLARFDKQPD